MSGETMRDRIEDVTGWLYLKLQDSMSQQILPDLYSNMYRRMMDIRFPSDRYAEMLYRQLDDKRRQWT